MIKIQIELQIRILVVSFSAIIITHDREELLLKCLDSLRPMVDKWQLILVANGRKLSDVVMEKARSLGAELKLLDSPDVLTPGKARNLALLEVRYDWIFFIDDDAYVLPSYWEIISPFLANPKIDVLGGPDSLASGMNYFSESLALTLSSPFCTGTTFSRHRSLGKKLIHADEEKLTSCNLWVRKDCVMDIKFPEDFKRAEETVFLQQLTNKAAAMYYHPKLRVGHHRRSHFFSLIRPTFFAGFYRSRSMRIKNTNGAEAFWLPSLFVLLHSFFYFDPDFFWVMGKTYAGVIVTASLGLSIQRRKILLFPLVSFLHYFIVFQYGLGFLTERLGRLKWK